MRILDFMTFFFYKLRLIRDAMEDRQLLQSYREKKRSFFVIISFLRLSLCVVFHSTK